MDLNIEMECRDCGWLFREAFREMPHGRALRCPFCHSLSLNLGEGSLVEAGREADGFERYPEGRFMERKIKL